MSFSCDLRTSVLLARRARYLSISLWLLIGLLVLSMMAAQFSGKQPATVALDIGISIIRLTTPILIIILTQELLSKEFDRRYFLTSLTYPRARHWLLVGRLFAILLLVYLTTIIMAVALSALASYIGAGYEQATPITLGVNYWLTVIYIMVDQFVLAAFATLLAVSASTPSFVLIGTVGFMLIARSFASVISLLSSNQYVVSNADTYKQTLAILNFILPDLGSLDIRQIALYGKLEFIPESWAFNLTDSMLYGIALSLIAMVVLTRKRLD